jgi:hypothetical protein
MFSRSMFNLSAFGATLSHGQNFIHTFDLWAADLAFVNSPSLQEGSAKSRSRQPRARITVS